MNEANYFSTNLKYLRQFHGYTQGELATKINVDQTTIGRWEDGNREPTIGNAINIARIFKVDIDELLSVNLKDGDMEGIISLGNDAKLTDAINSFTDGNLRRLLSLCTFLNNDNRDKVLEIVIMYLKNQENILIDNDGTIRLMDVPINTDNDDNFEMEFNEYQEMMKEIKDK